MATAITLALTGFALARGLALPRYRIAIEAELAALPGAESVAVGTSLPRANDVVAMIEPEVAAGEPDTRHRVQAVRAGPASSTSSVPHRCRGALSWRPTSYPTHDPSRW